MDPEALSSLADSISAQGVLQPLLVTGKPDGGYYLIAGERRWQAAQLAGLETVPVMVKEVTSDDRLVLALIENVQRQDLNVLEEASAYRRLMEEFQFTQEKVASAVGRDRATVANLVRLLRLPAAVQSDVMENRLTWATPGHFFLLRRARKS
jgi:ParB family chromosome partitioning protein